ncbi:MAG: hypothetical protein CMI23_01430 [Opitutae bacterium]|nr:hypothetical protein [Opitutae bacterium]
MSQPSEKSDEELANLSQKGDLDAFDELAGRYWNRIHRFLLSMFNHASAADVTQQALIRAYQKIHLFDNQQAFAPWLFTLTRRVAINVKKKEKKRKETTLIDETLKDAPKETVENLIQPLWEMASKVLNQNSYHAMRLHYAEDLSIREIAKVMGKTETGIKVMLFRSRQKLSKKAKSGGITL